MQKVKTFRCPECNKPYQSLATWSNHMTSQHPEVIPEGYTPARYFYYLQTGKTGNQCIVCKKPTDWNEATGKYNRFCNNPKCKEAYREMFKQRMINKHGKVTLLNDPEQQRKMLEAKKSHGTVTFLDGNSVGYNSTYEQDFLSMLSHFLHLNSTDIMGPSPHTYYYDYKNPNDKENEGRKFYIPDYWIPSLNLEIEIKQNTSTHPKILAIDKVKESQKDEMMSKVPGVRYIKIVDKDYSGFFDLLYSLKETYPDRKEAAAMEGFSAVINQKPRDWDETEEELRVLVERMANWKYGFIMNGHATDDFGENDINFETHYRSMNPADFGRYKCGVCWDYAAYQYETLNHKLHLGCFAYYVKFGPKDQYDDVPTHTFVVVPGNGEKNYYLESAMKYAAGLYEFETLSDVVSFIKNCSPDIRTKEVHCWQYYPYKYYGLKTTEFDARIVAEGKEEKITLKKDPKIQRIGNSPAMESIASDKFLNPNKKVRLYHGSNLKLKTIEPRGLDFGNSLQDMGWSSFFFESESPAYQWAIFVTLRDRRKSLKLPAKINGFPLGVSSFGLFATQEDLDFYCNYVDKENVTAYLYTVEVPAKDVGFGNDSTKAEYTLRYAIKPTVTKAIRITSSLLRKYVKVASNEEIESTRKSMRRNARGMLSFIYSRDFPYEKFAHKDSIDRLYEDIETGKLKPGDDIRKYIKDNGIVIDTVPLYSRMPLPSSATEFLESIGDAFKYYDGNCEIAIESSGYSRKNKYPVFVILTKGTSPLARGIMGVTGDEFSHASISFNASLNPMYSFGTRKLVPRREMGFVKTFPQDNLWDSNEGYWVYVTYVDAVSLEKMKKRLDFFVNNAEKMTYSFTGLPRVFLQLKSPKQYSWFCSAFVAEILSAGKKLAKDSTLYLPRDLKYVEDVELIDQGTDIHKYDQNVVQRSINKIKNSFVQDQEVSVATEAITADNIVTEATVLGFPFSDVKAIIARLPRNDLLRICGGTFKESPYIIYRNVEYYNNKPAGFVEVYCINPHPNDAYPNKSYIVIAVDPAYRKKGIAQKLVEKMLNDFKSNHLSKYSLVWKVDNDNSESIALAKRCGLVVFEQNSDKTFLTTQDVISKYGAPSVATEATIHPTKNGVYYKERWNSILERANKKYRERVEVLVFDNGRVYLVETKDGYLLPGGSSEPNKSLEEQARAELREESRLEVTNLKYEGTYFVDFDPQRKKSNIKHNPKFPIVYDGECNRVFTATFKDGYNGPILSKDKDYQMLHGRWVPFKEAKRILRPEHVGYLPVEHKKITAKIPLEPAQESIFKPSVTFIPGKIGFKKSRTLLIVANDPSNLMITEIFEIQEIRDKLGNVDAEIIDMNEFITYFLGGNGALLEPKSLSLSSKNIIADELIKNLKKLKTEKSRTAVFKKLPEACTMYTSAHKNEAILFNVTPYAYGLLPFDGFRVDYGAVPRAGAEIKNAISDYHEGNVFHHMTDPNLRGKGKMVADPTKIKLYHVSTVLDLTTLTPRATRTPMRGENVPIPRVSTAPTVDKCFGAIYCRFGAKYAIYEPQLTKKTRVMIPAMSTVPDQDKSNEHWILDPVKVKKIDEVYLLKVGKNVLTLTTSPIKMEDENGKYEYVLDIQPSREGVRPAIIFFRICPKDKPNTAVITCKVDCEKAVIATMTENKAYAEDIPDLKEGLMEFLNEQVFRKKK